jgi:hypothetical protein
MHAAQEAQYLAELWRANRPTGMASILAQGRHVQLLALHGLFHA